MTNAVQLIIVYDKCCCMSHIRILDHVDLCAGKYTIKSCQLRSEVEPSVSKADTVSIFNAYKI